MLYNNILQIERIEMLLLLWKTVKHSFSSFKKNLSTTVGPLLFNCVMCIPNTPKVITHRRLYKGLQLKCYYLQSFKFKCTCQRKKKQ